MLSVVLAAIAAEPAMARPHAGGAQYREYTAADEALAAARRAVGSPYSSGGTSRRGFDCSGLTRWAYRRAGISLPHSSFAQARRGQRVRRGDIVAGDLVFFDTAGPGASHVGIATDGGHAISATTSGGVMEHTIRRGYWGSHYLGARRIA